MNKEWNVNFFEIMMCDQKVETGAVFTMKEMNKEWNVNFLQITIGAQKVLRLELYLQRKKLKRTLSTVYFTGHSAHIFRCVFVKSNHLR